jgi:GH24 family phage-related lysozyme (muramidase)
LENNWTLDPAIQLELSDKWYDQPEVLRDFGVKLNPDMIRQDLTMKSNQGYLGQIKDNEGYTMTEQSIDVDIDGKKVLMPLLVPGLSNEEIASIKENKPLDSAYEKAVAHGKQRIKEGQSPFFEDKPQSIVLESDDVPIGNVGKDVEAGASDDIYKNYILSWEGDFFPEAKKATEDEKELTIGYGHYGEDVKPGQTITREEADVLLDKDIQKRIPAIMKAIPKFNNLSENLRKNIVSSWYRGSLSGSPKTIELINQGKFKEAAKEFLDNDEYRNAEKRNRSGIKSRMEATSKALAGE